MIRIAATLLVAVLLGACTSAPPAPTIGPITTPTPVGTSPAPSQSTPPATAAPTDEPTASGALPTPSSNPSPSATAGPGGIEGELASPGVLTACVAVVGLPAAGLTEAGQLDGYNVAFANEIANRLDLDISITQPLFEDLIGQVTGHSCDISVSSQNITASRNEQVSLVPYTRSYQPVLVAIGNPETIDTLSSLCGHAVSATTGTTHADLVQGVGEYVGQGLNDACGAASQPPIDLRTFQTELEAVTALLDGEVVAYLGNPSFVYDFPDQIVYSQASLPPARQGIAIALDHPQLRAAVQSALDAMIEDGVYRGILVQYLPSEESANAVSIVE